VITHLLTKIQEKGSQQIQFRLGHRTLIKISQEWVELDEKEISLSEWEDLKDYCLQSHDKIALETKGFVRGLINEATQSWSFSFIEWRDCMRAHFSYISQAEKSSHIQYQPYWDALKKTAGIHVIAAHRNQGKSTLLSEIIQQSRKDSPELVGLHALSSKLTLAAFDSVVHLGPESIGWEPSHPLYDGLDTVVVDMNEFIQMEKWIRFAEEGRKVFLTVCSSQLVNALQQARSSMQNESGLWERFCNQLSSVLFQKLAAVESADAQGGPVHEILVLKKHDQQELMRTALENYPELWKEKSEGTNYLSLNQSLIQALVRRRINIKSAFMLTVDPDELDQLLKKMGI